MWLPVASTVTGVETDSSKPASEAQTQSSTSTSTVGQTVRDMDTGCVSTTTQVAEPMNPFINSTNSESKSWFTDFTMSDPTSGFVNSLQSEYANGQLNSMEALKQPLYSMAPESASQQGNLENLESVNQPSTSVMSETAGVPSCEEKLSSVPEIGRELFWPRDFKLYIVNDNLKTNAARAKVVGECFALNCFKNPNIYICVSFLCISAI